MVKETVATVYGLTNMNYQSYITTIPPPSEFYFTRLCCSREIVN